MGQLDNPNATPIVTSKANTTTELPLILTPDEVSALLKLGRSATYEALRTGSIPAVRVGKLWRIGRDALLNWLNSGGLVP